MHHAIQLAPHPVYGHASIERYPEKHSLHIYYAYKP